MSVKKPTEKKIALEKELTIAYDRFINDVINGFRKLFSPY